MTPEALAVLHGLCFAHPRPWSAGEFTALLGAPGVFLCAGEKSFALGRVVAGEAELLTLAVHPDAQRAGLGRARLAAFEAEARTRGAEKAFLEVAADNAPALALYRSAGYGQTGARRGYYTTAAGQPVDALVLVKTLRQCGAEIG